MINLPEGVEIARLNEKKVRKYWDLLKDHSPSLTDGARSYEWMLEKWMAKDWVILEVGKGEGVIVMDSVRVGHKSAVHVHFFDHKLSKRLDVFRDCMIWAFFQFDLRRLEFLVPDHAPAVRRFLRRKLHATEEGLLREYAFYDGEARDVYMYSILRDEVL